MISGIHNDHETAYVSAKNRLTGCRCTVVSRREADSVFVVVDIVTLFGLSVLRPEVGHQASLRLLHITLKSMTFMD
jgi:hypothetical protein